MHAYSICILAKMVDLTFGKVGGTLDRVNASDITICETISLPQLLKPSKTF